MRWFWKMKKQRLDPELELARIFLADLFASERRAEELNRLLSLLLVPGVRLYYRGAFVSPKRLASIAREVAGGIVSIAGEMDG